MRRQRPGKISLFGPFGMANLGNDATLLAALSRLRTLFPDCQFCCICSFPDNVGATHRIEAVPHTLRRVRIWDRSVRLDKRVLLAMVGLGEELGEYVRAWRVLESTDAFIVPGTGLLTDVFGLSGWGPYGLFKWTLVAKLRRCKVMFVSVGAGPIYSGWGRVLSRYALSLADYRSYRDATSKTILEGLGVRATRDRVYPDLVFGLSSPSRASTSRRNNSRPIVGVGLMEYAGKYSVSSPTGDTYARYTDALGVFVGWLVDQNYDVRLLLGDSDTGAVDDLWAVLRNRLGDHNFRELTDERVKYVPTPSARDLVAQLDATDLVVATRFHNILTGLLLGKPVIALSFHHKCSSLMDQMGLSAYCHDIHDMNAKRLARQFEELVRNAGNIRGAVTEQVAQCRRALDEQDVLLLQHLGSRAPNPRSTAQTRDLTGRTLELARLAPVGTSPSLASEMSEPPEAST
jgi:polysaccharide pyruvyl transferase WcaK-like protein